MDHPCIQVNGKEYEVSVMVGILYVGQRKLIQLAMIAPHVAKDANLSCTTRLIVMEWAIELGIAFPGKMHWYTDNGADEVCSLNIAFGDLWLASEAHSGFDHRAAKMEPQLTGPGGWTK